MNKEVKEKWLTALRSGEYKQGKQRLVVTNSDNQKYCCLGVLCDLYNKETGNKTWGNNLDLPDEVVKWSGVKDSNPHITMGTESVTIAWYNDNSGDFLQIADIIEKEF